MEFSEFDSHATTMNKKEINIIIKECYPKISGYYSAKYPEVEIHNNIYERLSGVKGMSGSSCAQGEYDWSENKIYLYSSRLNTLEEVVRTLIHECVHSTQDKDIFDKLYEEGYTYHTHPYEAEARHAETTWKRFVSEELKLKLINKKLVR